MKEKEIRLPEGWKLKRFEEVIDIQGGSQPPKSEFIYEPQDDYIRLLQIRDFGEKPVPTFVPKSRVSKFCEETDILIARYGASLGRIVTGLSGAYNVALAKTIYDKSVLDDKFVFYLLQTPIFQNPLSMISRSAQNGFAKQDISDIEIPLPSLPEQHHIAQKLTALLAAVDEAKKRLENIPVLLKQFRQSVLAEAVSGRLTEYWRGTANYQQSEKITAPAEWEISTLGKEFKYGSCKKKSPEEILDNEWVLELEDIEKETSKLLSKETNQIRKAKSKKNIFKKNDVLYGKLRPYLNKIIIADEDGVCTTEIIPISENKKVNYQYLFYWLKSPYFFNYVNEITYGVNMPRLGTQDGKNALIAIPSKAEQTQIIHQVETYFTLADHIETEAKNALEKVNLLTQSILAKAFRGELSGDWRAQQAVEN